MFWWFCTQPNAKMIWYLDSAHQNSWKTLSFSNSYAYTHEKLITNQLYSSDKIMAQVKKHILFYVWWSSTQPKAKMIWYLDSAYQNSWKTLSLSNSSAHTHEKLITNQLYSSDKIMAQVRKTLIFMFWWFCTQPNAKMIWYLDSAHQNSWKTLYYNSS